MATNLQTLESNLARWNWKYETDLANNCIRTGVKTDNVEHFIIILRLTEDGEFLQFQAPKLLNLNDQIYKGPALQTMAAIQYQTKMLRLEYDPSDGEVMASIELPLEGAPLTENQFDRCLNGLIHIVDEHAMPRLRQTLATGNDPGAPSLAKQVLQILPNDFLQALAEALQELPQAS